MSLFRSPLPFSSSPPSLRRQLTVRSAAVSACNSGQRAAYGLAQGGMSRGVGLRRSLHDDEARVLKVFDDPLGGDDRHHLMPRRIRSRQSLTFWANSVRRPHESPPRCWPTSRWGDLAGRALYLRNRDLRVPIAGTRPRSRQGAAPDPARPSRRRSECPKGQLKVAPRSFSVTG